ncbi:MAG: antibiotic biosynthesis monooxygenase family protein [Ilumatobacteraceae bacterium]|nr:antibiotic biosynthesis monooxygenase family protein [Ilumatobacteraceae bacterium]
MIIVAGFLRVDPDQRTSYLEDCEGVIRAGRAAAGCIDFHLSADPLESDRINIFERWDSAESVETFRGSGPSEDQQATITEANVLQHEIASTISLT